MAKTRPAEFPTDWHHERHLADLERELEGRHRRLADLKASGASDDALAATEAEIDAVRAQLTHYGVGQSKASKRPGAAKETRA